MGIIERNLTVSGKKSKRILAIFDSGSSFSIIKKSVLDEIGYLKKYKKIQYAELGDGRRIRFDEVAILQVKMNKNDYFYKFVVADNVPEQMVIGVDFLQEFGHTLEFKKDKVISKKMHLKNRRGVYKF